MRPLPQNTAIRADGRGFTLGGVDAGNRPLSPDEAAVFLAAALALLPPDVDLRSPPGDPLPAPVQDAIGALWLRTGRAPPAPISMPEQPLAPGLLGIFWRRLRAVLAWAPRDETE